jgi:hypothetical protein
MFSVADVFAPKTEGSVDDRTGKSGIISFADTHVPSGLASEHTLKERRGFRDLARAREARGFEHHVRFQHVVHPSESEQRAFDF